MICSVLLQQLAGRVPGVGTAVFGLGIPTISDLTSTPPGETVGDASML